jgi:hypothetical protein
MNKAAPTAAKIQSLRNMALPSLSSVESRTDALAKTAAPGGTLYFICDLVAIARKGPDEVTGAGCHSSSVVIPSVHDEVSCSSIPLRLPEHISLTPRLHRMQRSSALSAS